MYINNSYKDAVCDQALLAQSEHSLELGMIPSQLSVSQAFVTSVINKGSKHPC